MSELLTFKLNNGREVLARASKLDPAPFPIMYANRTQAQKKLAEVLPPPEGDIELQQCELCHKDVEILTLGSPTTPDLCKECYEKHGGEATTWMTSEQWAALGWVLNPDRDKDTFCVREPEANEALNSLAELLEICRTKCGPTDEIILKSGRTNHEAVCTAYAVLERLNSAQCKHIPKSQPSFTVLLLYPDYLCENQYGTETYMISVNADSVAEATRKAQEEAAAGDDTNDPTDFHCLMVVAGEHNDIKEAK